jgi:hypothetical protein
LRISPPIYDRRRGLAWVVDLYTLLTTHRNVLAAGRCGVVNSFIGLLLMGLATLIGAGDMPGGPIQAIAIGVVGALMVSGTITIAMRPSVAFEILTGQGILLVVFEGIFTIDSIRWLFQRSPGTSFRYLPGMFLAPWAFGWGQIGAFGPWPCHAKLLRRTGIGIGVVCEALFLAGALILASSRFHAM